MALKAGRVGVHPSVVDIAGKIKAAALPIIKCSKSAFGSCKVGNNISVSSGVISVPVATTEALGVIKVGTGLTIDENGVLSVSAEFLNKK